MTSRSRKGSACICIACQEKSYYYVALLKNHGGTTAKHWFVCFHCYENDRWQEAVSKIKPPTKRTAPKRIRKPSVKVDATAWDDSIEKIEKPTLDW